MKVLIIDDDPILIMVCMRLMKLVGFATEVSSARDGREALGWLKEQLEIKPTELPDVIFLDINMPVMNGWDFLDEYISLK